MADKKEGAHDAPRSVSGSEKPAPEAEKETDAKAEQAAEQTADAITEVVADAVDDVKKEAEQCQTQQAADVAAYLATLQQMQQTHMGMMSDILDKLNLTAERLAELTSPTTSREPLTQEHLSPQTPEPITQAPAEAPETEVVAEVAPEKAAAEKAPPVARRARRVV